MGNWQDPGPLTRSQAVANNYNNNKFECEVMWGQYLEVDNYYWK